jgi:hypothetical protein
MATLIAVFLFFGTIVALAFSQLLTEECKAWIPWATRLLIKAAVLRFPEDQRQRFAEEWEAHVNDMPGKIGEAFRLLIAACRMRPMLEEGPNPPVDEDLGKVHFVFHHGRLRLIAGSIKVPARSTVKLDLKTGRIVRVSDDEPKGQENLAPHRLQGVLI